MLQIFRIYSAGILLLFPCAVLTGCSSGSPFARDIDYAAGADNWRSAGGLLCRITVKPADGEAFTGQLVYRVATHRFVIQRLHAGALEQVGYGDGRLWTRAVPPDDISKWTEMVIYTSFLTCPFDLTGKSVSVRALEPMPLGGQMYRVGLVERANKDKWALFVEQSDNIPRALVPLAPRIRFTGNYTGPDSGPGKDGYAVVYDKVVNIEGVSLPTRWTIWGWNSHEGVNDAPLAIVELSNPSFGNLQPSASPQFDLNMAGIGGNWWR